MHPYYDIGDVSSFLRGSTSSFSILKNGDKEITLMKHKNLLQFLITENDFYPLSSGVTTLLCVVTIHIGD